MPPKNNQFFIIFSDFMLKIEHFLIFMLFFKKSELIIKSKIYVIL